MRKFDASCQCIQILCFSMFYGIIFERALARVKQMKFTEPKIKKKIYRMANSWENTLVFYTR